MNARVDQIENRWSTEQLVAGIGLSRWLQLVHANGWKIHPVYAHRALWITGLAALSSALGTVESVAYGRAIRDTAVDKPPLIILGHWRSGTTHLHNVLGRAPDHTYSSIYQVVFPNHFLLTGKLGPRLLSGTLEETRSYDNMKHGWHEAAEDEIALLKLTGGLSFYGALMFPDRYEEYERLIDFEGCPDAEIARFKAALDTFVRKQTLASGGKRVVIKSCPHSARIPMLLELFPDARFVHIHRHPARVFSSMTHMRSKVDWENFLHRPQQSFIEARREHTALIGERVFSRLLADRSLIPEGNLIELAYDDFVGNELELARTIWSQHDLDDWEGYEPTLTAYLDGLAGYQRNKLEIDDETRDFVYERWRAVYDAYDYER